MRESHQSSIKYKSSAMPKNRDGLVVSLVEGAGGRTIKGKVGIGELDKRIRGFGSEGGLGVARFKRRW